MGVKLDVDRDNQRLTATPPHGPTMNLLHPSTKVVKANLEKWIRMSILGRLAEQVNTPKPRRKDLAGITTLVDRRATLSLFRTTKSPIKKISVQFFRRLLVSVVAGSVRAGDRLHAAGLIHTDACETDGQRHTTKHLWWECVKYKEVRKEYVGYIERVRAVANKSGKRTSEHIEELLSNNCFLHTGVSPADKEAVEWATARGTEGRPVLEYPDSLRIRQTPGTLWVHINGKRFIAVFTDGSAYCTASEWLAHGGWGVYTPGAQDNTAGHLSGQPCTSYRAEGGAILDAVTRADAPICVICDNLSAVTNLSAIIEHKGSKITWQSSDECADYWEAIARHIDANQDKCPTTKWMPSHLDDPKRGHIL